MVRNLLRKSLLLGVALLAGASSAWSADALTKSLVVTGYEATHLYDFQNKDFDGSSIASFDDLGSMGVSSTATVGAAYGSNNWYDDTSNGRGIRLQSGGGRTFVITVDIKKDDYIIVNGGNAAETYEISMTNGTTTSILSTDDYLCFKANGDASNITLNVHRYNYILQILVMTKDAGASTADYTINYKAGGSTVKTESDNVAVGTIVPILSTFWVGDVKYVTDDGQTDNLTVVDGDNNLDISVTEADKWTYTLKAVDSESNDLKTIESANIYTGESKTVYYPQAIYVGGKWYETSDHATYSHKTITEGNPTVNVVYTESDRIDYFFETADVTVNAKRDNGYVPDRASCGDAVRLGNGGYILTPVLAGGIYTVTVNKNNSNSGTASLRLDLRDDADNIITTTSLISQATNSSYAESSVLNFIIPDGMKLQLTNTYAGNSNFGFDYMILKKSGEASVSKAITSAGWATYCSPYALDLENATGLTDAYIVTGGSNGVLAKTSVIGGKVPANTGLLLKGAEGTATIPVVASSTTNVDANILVGVNAETAIDAEDGWVLMADPSLGFYQNSNDFTVGANTAYIPVASLAVPGARAFYSLFDETTGIGSMHNSEGIMHNEVFNLNGQRVSAPQKGLYIVNGKKVIVK